MRKKLLSKKKTFFNEFWQFCLLIGLFTIWFTPMKAQHPEFRLPSSQLKLTKTIKINSRGQGVTREVTQNAIYSNLNKFINLYSNGDAQLQGSNTTTSLVADSLGLFGAPPFTVGSFTFSVGNANAVNVSASPLIRFYANDGIDGGPGTLIAGFDFDPINFTAGEIHAFTANVNPFTITTGAIWAGIVFDNFNGTSGATLAQLNLLGPGIFGPIDRGSSTDGFFQTDSAGYFGDNNPVGSMYDFSGNPVANFGWEIVSALPLPVTLNNFKVTQVGKTNSLTWNTSQETNLDYFEIERSQDGINFSKSGSVKAAGNSSTAQQYQFIDENPVCGTNYYRLRIVDKDNSFKYSDVKSIKNSFLNFSLYPNPVIENLLIEINSGKNENAIISISDLQGRTVISRQVTLLQGLNQIPVNVNKLSSGNYNIRIQSETNSYSRKFSKL